MRGVLSRCRKFSLQHETEFPPVIDRVGRRDFLCYKQEKKQLLFIGGWSVFVSNSTVSKEQLQIWPQRPRYFAAAVHCVGGGGSGKIHGGNIHEG